MGRVALVAGYHFLGLGRFVPWVEVLGAAGRTGLKVPEIGVGASYFVTDRLSLYIGYRLQQISKWRHCASQFWIRVTHRRRRSHPLSPVAPRARRAEFEPTMWSAPPAPARRADSADDAPQLGLGELGVERERQYLGRPRRPARRPIGRACVRPLKRARSCRSGRARRDIQLRRRRRSPES